MVHRNVFIIPVARENVMNDHNNIYYKIEFFILVAHEEEKNKNMKRVCNENHKRK